MRRPYPFDDQCYNDFADDQLDHSCNSQFQQCNRKRQRRDAAALMVESLWNGISNSTDNTNIKNISAETNVRIVKTISSGRKSTAQPRPELNVPPRGIGPINDPNENDVLCGRGGLINKFSGNVQFRNIINSKKKGYLDPSVKKLEKAYIASGIVNDIRAMNPPGRFLKEDRGTGLWFDIGDSKAIKKVGQALREDAPDMRSAIDRNGSSGQETHRNTTYHHLTELIKSTNK